MTKPLLPNFGDGVPIDGFPDGGMVLGNVDGEEVVLARRGDKFFAVGATCPHYGGPLVKGLIIGTELRCPLHHACFSLKTGEVLRPPAFDPIPRWRVERIREKVFVREKLAADVRKPERVPVSGDKPPASVVIIGGGAAGLAAADTLRREGYDGRVTMISADDSAPYDRPNLSKEYLEGVTPEDWIPLRSPAYYTERHIDLVLNSRVSAIDAKRRRIQIENGDTYDFGALLLATGAEPVPLAIEGGADSQVYYLRSFADSRTLGEKANSGKQVVVAGASFIGLEVAASLAARGIRIHVVAPGRQPLEHVLGLEVGQFMRRLHEAHGVVFHMGETLTAFDGQRATLSKGKTVDADFVVAGVGVQPSLVVAEQAELKLDRGIVVNEYLETSAPGIFAAGDVARWPNPYFGQSVRVEHWVVAERQGQVAAKNILGRKQAFQAVPFFWTRQYGVSIKYVGYADKWDSVDIDGSLEEKDCTVSYQLGRRTLAIATIGRDRVNLKFEAEMEASLRPPSLRDHEIS